MQSYRIFTDSTCDLPQSLVEQAQLDVIPMAFEMDGTTIFHYIDERECSIHDFYTQLSAGKMAKTSQITPTQFTEAFTPVLQQGLDILYVGFSSGLSGTYQSACLAANMLEEEFPERKVVVVDSLCASSGEGLLALKAAQLQQQGFSLQENVAWLNEHKFQLVHWFSVDNLDQLKRGGRISSTTAFVGNALSIKPIMSVDQTGHLKSVSKTHGKKKCLQVMAEKLEELDRSVSTTVTVSHSEAEQDAKALCELIEERYPDVNIHVCSVGPIIGAHTGKGTIVLCFFGQQRVD